VVDIVWLLVISAAGSFAITSLAVGALATSRPATLPTTAICYNLRGKPLDHHWRVSEMAGTWKDAVQAAMNILGPNGKVPEPSKTVEHTAHELGDAWTNFDEARKTLKNSFDTYQKVLDKFLGAMRADADAISRDDLGLDHKNKEEEAKKILNARKLLLDYMNNSLKRHETELNNLTKLKAAE
jgi:hypothetical protein